MMNPNDSYDDFDTQIQSDELIPDGYEDRDDSRDPRDFAPQSGDDDGDYGYGEDAPVDIDGGYDADGYYGDDRDGYDGGDDFPW